MTHPKRFRDPASFQQPPELLELGQLLEAVDPDSKADLMDAHRRLSESVLRRRRILTLVHEALSELRLDIKYLTFDLEMTRRERDELHEKIEGEDRAF